MTLLSRRRSLALVALGLASVVAGCGGGHHQPSSAGATCPLTDLPAPGGKVPQRPALAVKVDNLPAARPPYGLDSADVVYEQPVEGGITRFIAIYQCRDAPRIQPVRSGRLIDPDLVRQYGTHPLFAYAGAIQPVVAKVDASSLIDVGVNRAPSAYSRDPARQAPHNLVSSTAKLYAAGSAQHAPAVPPAPVFRYGPLADHVPSAAVHIAYTVSGVTWTWQPQAGQWSRRYSDTGPATLGGGGQIATANVVVMRVVVYPSAYVEDATGAHENLLVLTGSGPAQVFRNGAVINGNWRRPSLSDQTELVDAAGQSIALTPGQTWIELVPTTVNVTVTP
jgi:hypothetical protein